MPRRHSMRKLISFIKEFVDDRPNLVIMDPNDISAIIQVGNTGSHILLKSGESFFTSTWESELQYILELNSAADIYRYDARKERESVDEYRHTVLGWPARAKSANLPADKFSAAAMEKRLARENNPVERVGPGSGTDEERELARVVMTGVECRHCDATIEDPEDAYVDPDIPDSVFHSECYEAMELDS
jgi:hypothetical protein